MFVETQGLHAVPAMSESSPETQRQLETRNRLESTAGKNAKDFLAFFGRLREQPRETDSNQDPQTQLVDFIVEETHAFIQAVEEYVACNASLRWKPPHVHADAWELGYDYSDAARRRDMDYYYRYVNGLLSEICGELNIADETGPVYPMLDPLELDGSPLPVSGDAQLHDAYRGASRLGYIDPSDLVDCHVFVTQYIETFVRFDRVPDIEAKELGHASLELVKLSA